MKHSSCVEQLGLLLYMFEPSLAPENGVTNDALEYVDSESEVATFAHVGNLNWWEKPASASAARNSSSWFSNLKGGFRLRYRTVGDVQLRFLGLLSTSAYQNFTFVCNNVNAWYSQRTKDHARALRFRGRNEALMTFGEDSPTVPVDDCQFRDGKTVFVFKTKQTATLPIVDFQPSDFGGVHQSFGFEIGPVCFQ